MGGDAADDSAVVPEDPGASDVSAQGPTPSPVPQTLEPALRSRPGLAVPRRVLVLAAAALVAVAGIAIAAFLLFQPGPSVDKMVPDTVDVYLTIYLDPSLDQKMNLARLVHKFPGLKSDADVHKRIEDVINQASTRKISYERDIASWIGSRATLVVQTSDNGHFVFLIDSRSDDRARAQITDYRNNDTEGKSLSWKDDTYQGVSISIGSGATNGAPQTQVYAYFDRTLIVSDSEAMVKDAVDTDQGRKARLVDSAGYKSMAGLLPKDRLALLYVNGKHVVAQIKTQLRSSEGGAQIPQDTINQLDAFTGLGLTISAASDGLAGDLEVQVDSSKLSPANRALMTASSGPNRLLDWIPQRAYVVVATTGIKQPLQSSLDQVLANSPDAKQGFDQLGLTGSNGALSHLAGDLALEISPGSAPAPGGVLLLDTDDAGSLQTFLDRLAGALVDQPPVPGLTVSKQIYKGSQITSITAPSLTEQGVAPAYAVSGAGIGLIGSSAEQVQAAIDTTQGFQRLATGDGYKTSVSHADQNPDILIYIDIGEAARAARQALTGIELANYDRDVAPNLQPLTSFILTSKNHPDRISEKLFLLTQ